MENLHLSFDNVLKYDGIIVSITGMLIVFLSLLFISFFIRILPIALAKLDELKEKKTALAQPVVKAAPVAQNLPEDAELNAAIMAVIAIELEQLNSADDQKITIDTHTPARSVWAAAGKMRTLSARISS